jgi:FkbM family methyltransferase
MNFSAIPQAKLYGWAFRLPLACVPKSARMPILQGRLCGMKWIAGSGNHGCWLGSYEYLEQRAFARIVPEGGVVFDIGAHAGFYTLLASVLAGPRGKVFAFEPHPRNLEHLKRHLRLNSIGHVRVIEAAVADTTGWARFAAGRDSSTGRLAATGELLVKTLALDDAIASGRFPAPDCLKIDVEGAEMLVLTGAEATLRARHPAILLATHGPTLHRECCDFLIRLGFELQAVNGRPLEGSSAVIAVKGKC